MGIVIIICVLVAVLDVLAWSLCRIAAISDRRMDETMYHQAGGREPWQE